MSASQAERLNCEAMAAADSVPTSADTSKKSDDCSCGHDCSAHAELEAMKARLREANLFAQKCEEYILLSATATAQRIDEIEQLKKRKEIQVNIFKEQETQRLEMIKNLQIELKTEHCKLEKFHGIFSILERDYRNPENWNTAFCKLVHDHAEQMRNYELVQERDKQKFDMLEEPFITLNLVSQRLCKERDELKGEVEKLQWKVSELGCMNGIKSDDYDKLLQDRSQLSGKIVELKELLDRKDVMEYELTKLVKLYDLLEVDYDEVLHEKERLLSEVKKLKPDFRSNEEQSSAEIEDIRSAVRMFKQELCDAHAGTSALATENAVDCLRLYRDRKTFSE